MRRHASGFQKVAREVVLEVPEPYDGYREHLVGKLLEVIDCQRSSSSTISRRKDVRRLLKAFGQQVAAQTNKVEDA